MSPTKRDKRGDHLWDVFISHAHEDKTDIARPLAEALRSNGLRVWYDDFSLRLGDSLRQSIDHGLSRSRYGIVILSEHFFEKHWPTQELNALAIREVNGEKVILPVWHELSFEQVRQFSPVLADRVAVQTSRGLPAVVKAVLAVVTPLLPKTHTVALVRAHAEVLRLNAELERSYDITLEALGDALDLRDAETESHSKRVTAYTIAIARQMGLQGAPIRVIARGAFLHDIGKMAIPDSILRKPGALTREETTIMQEHCYRGYLMLRKIPFLTEAAEIVYAHQEKWDGAGYPRGLKGNEIPLGARLFSVADTLEAITSDRPYRAAGSLEAARKQIEGSSGHHFDPAVVRAFLQIPVNIWADLRKEIDRQTWRLSGGRREPALRARARKARPKAQP